MLHPAKVKLISWPHMYQLLIEDNTP